jgi:uncharacterized protein YndB with AHSA1/START domain
VASATSECRLQVPPLSRFAKDRQGDHFARWYGPVGFPVHRDAVEVDARVGGRQRFEMVSEADPSMRTGFDGRFDEVVRDELLSSRGAWAERSAARTRSPAVA